jgi:hypothetical protein
VPQLQRARHSTHSPSDLNLAGVVKLPTIFHSRGCRIIQQSKFGNPSVGKPHVSEKASPLALLAIIIVFKAHGDGGAHEILHALRAHKALRPTKRYFLDTGQQHAISHEITQRSVFEPVVHLWLDKATIILHRDFRNGKFSSGLLCAGVAATLKHRSNSKERQQWRQMIVGGVRSAWWTRRQA